jgi:hypothetical protein
MDLRKNPMGFYTIKLLPRSFIELGPYLAPHCVGPYFGKAHILKL